VPAQLRLSVDFQLDDWAIVNEIDKLCYDKTEIVNCAFKVNLKRKESRESPTRAHEFHHGNRYFAWLSRYFAFIHCRALKVTQMHGDNAIHEHHVRRLLRAADPKSRCKIIYESSFVQCAYRNCASLMGFAGLDCAVDGAGATAGNGNVGMEGR